jgi:RNA polymerase sigma-70 factor (ECF subfamily)
MALDAGGAAVKGDSLALRGLLFAIAYRMTGSVADAEDIVQESYLRFQRARDDEVHDERAFLTQIVTRLCIDHGRAARQRREVPEGEVTLPEPVSSAGVPDDAVALAESLSIAFLVLVQKLAPVERAVFLLREVFGHDYDEIARAVGRSETACRQIAHRAKEHIGERRVRFPATDAEVRAAIALFAELAQGGDVDAMRRLLDPEVTLYVDGGEERPAYGRVRAIHRPLHGADAVSRFLVAAQAQAPEGVRYEIREANGAPALYSYRAERLIAVMSFDVDEGRIRDIFLLVDPRKLARASGGAPAN